MADLAEALDAALRARYRISEVRTPITQRRGLLARMNQLEKYHTRGGDRPGQAATRAAESAGVSPRTWGEWRKGSRPPSASSARKLEGAYTRQITLPAFRRALEDKKIPDKVTITAIIKWSRSDRKQYNRTRHRTVNFTQMRPVMRDVIRAWVLAGPEAAADKLQRGVSDMYSEPNDGSRPGIEFEGNQVEITFP